MFCIVYRWEVSAEFEREFIDLWGRLTKIIRDEHGGLGSRLHRSGEIWFAYAQWPSKSDWYRPKMTSDESLKLRTRISEISRELSSDIMGEVVFDLLIPGGVP
ncbi:antibiotic biosynthesis monooxygenase [Pseudomonas hunanensis]|uniref:antibiotic biosynthesis monooxygenase n=1 Tax=Pseudomonas hunanensis TaxID=1247546 RepID=UPI003D66357F